MELSIQRSIGAGRGEVGPVYRQIAEQIRARVQEGTLREGDRLPPIRDLARQLRVNRDTVSLAYESLAAEGLLESQVGRGTFVRGLRPRTAREDSGGEVRLSSAAERLLDYERSRPHYPADGQGIPLHAVVPDPALFPVDAFRRAVNRVLTDRGASLLGYGGPQGHAGMRQVLAERFGLGGVRVGADSIVLCQGASQGIALALRLFAESGDSVAIEEPTYQNALGTLVGLGLRAVPVPMRRDGPDLAALDRVLARPEVKVFYTIPTFHNPMGISTSLAHRQALLEIASRHGKPVIEDAYEMDLRFAGRSVLPLAALDESGRVVLLTSFSKSLFPGVRCGAVVARGRLVDALLVLRHASDLGGALPLQAALADFIRNGAYDRHLATLRRVLRRRRDALLKALSAEMPEGATWTTPEGGYQVWVELPEPVDTRDLFNEALRAGVKFAPGYQFQHDGRASRALRLSIGVADEAALRDGVVRLGRILRERRAAGREGPHEAAVHM